MLGHGGEVSALCLFSWQLLLVTLEAADVTGSGLPTIKIFVLSHPALLSELAEIANSN